MTSSGMKRGLAVAAISALAVTGLPLTAANATPLASQEASATEVTLYSQDNNTASIRNDGENTTVHLVAGGGSDVVKVHFEYSTDGTTWKDIATVSRANGAFSTEWAPTASIYNTDVHVRATGINASNLPITATADDKLVKVSAGEDAVDISKPSGWEVGVFQQPYAGESNAKALGVIAGTTSALTGTVALDNRTGSAPAMDAPVESKTGDTIGKFKGTVDFSGYTWDVPATGKDAVDEALVGATRGSDDVESVKLYKQKISEVGVSADSTLVPDGKSATVTVKVVDQKGLPIAGAQVAEDKTGGLVKYTDVNGLATFSASGSAAGDTHSYYVNTTDANLYDDGVDYKRSITIKSYKQEASWVGAKSADGDAFDIDEYAAGDIEILVKDQNGVGMANQVVRYYWSVVPFDGSKVPDTTELTAVTDADGKAPAVFAPGTVEGTWTLHTYINKDGNPGQSQYDLGGAPLTVKTGEAVPTWKDGVKKQVGSAMTSTFDGVLKLADGTPLAKRTVTVSLTSGSEPAAAGDAVFAPQAAQPAGTTRNTDLSATVVTDEHGKFSVAVTDPTEKPKDEVNELGATLHAVFGDQSDDLTVDFLTDLTPYSITAIDSTKLIDGIASPGRPVALDFIVKNKAGDELTDVDVKVEVDHGFLTPNANSASELKADPAPAEGGLYGEWKSIGQSDVVATEDTPSTSEGKFGVTVAIEDDNGFDDDGHVLTTVKATAGPAVGKAEVHFSTKNEPLNPKAVEVNLAKGQDSKVLPDARIDQAVYFDLFAKDQFGNLVKAEIDEVYDNNPIAHVTGEGGKVWSNYTGEAPALKATSPKATDQEISAKWVSDTNTWTDGDTVTAGFQAKRDEKKDAKSLVATSDKIKWYTVDFAASSFTWFSDPSGATAVPVGTPVHQSVTVKDQLGQAIPGMYVKFVRSGPNAQGGDFNWDDWTGTAGTANYDWAGTDAGTAKVSAFVYDEWKGSDTGALVKKFTANPITFGETVVKPVAISADLKLSNNAKGNDVAVVDAPAAAKGATVKLFRINRFGKKVLVATKTANTAGNARFVKADANKRGVTKYVAYVSKTAKTLADWSPIRRIR